MIRDEIRAKAALITAFIPSPMSHRSAILIFSEASAGLIGFMLPLLFFYIRQHT
jgi:hypothetical protein